MSEQKIICIECPRGCEMTAFVEDNRVVDVHGNFCVRGKTYAQNELINPLRVVTSTIRLHGGEMLPVKTDGGVSKSKIFTVMQNINKLTAQKPIKIGQVLSSDIDGSGTKLVATKNII